MKNTMAIVASALSCLSAIAADLVVPSGATHTVASNETYDSATLSGGTVQIDAGTLKCGTVSAAVSSTIKFNGGEFELSGYNSYGFEPSEGATLRLESVDGKDIALSGNWQPHCFSRGAGQVETAGDGDMVVFTRLNGGNRMYLTLSTNRVTWGHSGDLRATGGGGLKLVKGGALPSGVATGGIKLEGSTHLLLDGFSETDVNSIEGPVVSGNWVYLKFGKYKDGVFRNAPDVGGRCAVHKYGADTTLTLDNVGFRILSVLHGTVRAVGGASTVSDFEMQNGSSFVVDGTTFSATNSATFTRNDKVRVVNGGVLDVVGASDATFNLESSGTLVKRGSGVWNVYCDTSISGRLHVAGGTIRLRHMDSCAADQWWRMSVTKQYGAPAPTICELALFDEEGTRINQKLSAVTTRDASTLAAGTAMFPANSPFDTESARLAYLFDGSNSDLFGVWAGTPPDTPTITDGDSATWLTVVFRLATGQTGAVAADIMHGYRASYARGLKVESSPTGADGTWVERGDWSWSGRASSWDTWLHGDSHLTFTVNERDGTDANGRGFAAGTTLRVDGGAILDTALVRPSERVVSSLEIDCAAEIGTITDLAFAETGVFNLSNVPNAQEVVLPLSIMRPTDTAFAKGWRVFANGVEKRAYHVVYINGILRLHKPGSMLIVW